MVDFTREKILLVEFGKHTLKTLFPYMAFFDNDKTKF